MTIQDVIGLLKEYWAAQGALVMEPFDMEVGAGTQSPLTFFHALDRHPWQVAYVQPSRRPVDGRYGDNPNRLYQHHQFQVVLKPAPDDVVALYLASLSHLGLDNKKHDIRFVEDNWEAPTLGASGLGWEVWLDGMEITQFTYFQQMAGYDCRPVPVEMTYGIERLASYLVGSDDIWSVPWGPGATYRDLFGRVEYEQSRYSFEEANAELLVELFDRYETECYRLLDRQLERPAYEWFLKSSHLFNTLDARGAIAVVQRQAYIARLRRMARKTADVYRKRVLQDV